MRFTPEKFRAAENGEPSPVVAGEAAKQDLYPLDLVGGSAGQLSDSAHIRFGIRQVTSAISTRRVIGYFQINGKNDSIRGAGYSFDCCCGHRRRDSKPN